MTLRRTGGALASMHIFYKADVVVFCEGGHPKSHSDALIYCNDARTLDGVFWSSVMALFCKDKRLHFKSVGSKPTLLAISNDVHERNIETVTVCLDSDYDRLLSKHSSNNRLAYTAGYSWESDVLQGYILEEMLVALVGIVSDDLIRFLRETIAQIETDLVRWCEADISLKYRDKTCVLDRRNPLSSVDITSYPLCVAHERLSRRLKAECGYKRKPNRVIKITNSNVRNAVYGKLISKAFYHLLISVAKQVMANIKIEYDNVMRLAISFTLRDLTAGNKPDLYNHYQTYCNNI